MQGPFLRKYGVETKIDFVLYDTDGASLKVDAAHAAGDSVIMKDEGAEANTDNAFVDEGTGYSITLTATEMQAARVVVYIVDQTSPKVWLDEALVIDTYGNASAQHAFDLDTATVNLASATATQIDNIESDTSELQTDDIPGLIAALNDPTVAAIADGVWDEVAEGALTARQLLRLFLAVLGGKSAGGGTATITFRDNADGKDRVTATVDANGNRSAVSLDGT